jgi:hypothetical protein
MHQNSNFTPREPPGPWTPADGLEPFTLLPGQAVDLALHWAWGDEPYAVELSLCHPTEPPILITDITAESGCTA